MATLHTRTVFFVSDGTGITAETFGNSILSQFGGLGFSVGRIVPSVNGHFQKPESVRAWLARIANQRESRGAAL